MKNTRVDGGGGEGSGNHPTLLSLPIFLPRIRLTTFCIFSEELYIPIIWSFQTQLAGPILFTDFPFCLFPLSNPIPYFGLKCA